MSTVFTKTLINEPEHGINSYDDQCAYYPKRHSIIVNFIDRISPVDDYAHVLDTAGLYEYDLATKTWKNLVYYADVFEHEALTMSNDGEFHAIHVQNDKLFLISSISDAHEPCQRIKVVNKFNLMTNQFENVPTIVKMCRFDSAMLIPLMNEVHFFPSRFGESARHVIVNHESMKEIYNEPISNSDKDAFNGFCAELIPVPSRQMLVSVGAYDDRKIAALDLKDTKMDWKLIGETPFGIHNGGQPHKTFLFDDIIVAMNINYEYPIEEDPDVPYGQIWCMDANELRQNKWYESECRLPIMHGIGEEVWTFKDREDQLHVISLLKAEHGGHKLHFHAPIRRIIPKKLRVARENKYVPLVFGYLRQEETVLVEKRLPFSLKRLISAFVVFY